MMTRKRHDRSVGRFLRRRFAARSSAVLPLAVLQWAVLPWAGLLAASGLWLPVCSAAEEVEQPAIEKTANEKDSAAQEQPAPQGKPSTDEKPATEKKPASSLDDELLKGLGGDPLGELKDLPPPGPKTKKDASGQDATDRLDDELLKGLEQGADMDRETDDDGNPLVPISRKMRQVEKRMLDNRCDEQTRQLQQRIVTDLDKLIDEIKKQQQSSSSSSSSEQQQTASRTKVGQPQTTPSSRNGRPSEKPASDSSQRQGAAEVRKPDMAQMQDLLKDIWGQLPPRLRQQMLQSSVEEFLPKYELLIEEYFKTLVKRRQDRP